MLFGSADFGSSEIFLMIRELSGGRLILASGSPRRREILSGAGLKFEIVESGVDERLLAGEGARDFALRMSEEKALTVSQKFLDALVIGADTVVEIDGKILGKPRDPEDARSMLNLLSARTHNVITAFAIARNSQ